MEIGMNKLLKIALWTLILGACSVTFASSANTEAGGISEPAAVGYSVGGTVTGLIYVNSMVLQNNGGNDMTVVGDGPFTFINLLPDGAPYNVTILIQPILADQTCSVTNSSGNIDGANITDVLVDCAEASLTPSCPGGVGDKNILVLDHDYDSGTVVDCIAEDSVTLLNTSVIKETFLNLRSPSVSLSERVSIELGSRLNVLSPASAPTPLRLNDTGILTCGDNGYNLWLCPVATYPGQDAEYGRDATHYDDSDGHAGFSFTKLDANGDPLLANATSWSCVRDNVTGLVWEVKTDDGGLHDKDNTYSWYNTDSTINGGYEGTQNGGSCTGSSCDTQGYVEAVNTQGLCGPNDWRMPTIKELENIARLDGASPSIDSAYFPNTTAWSYWSSTPAADYYPYGVWSVWFTAGDTIQGSKYSSGHVRLVRGRQ